MFVPYFCFLKIHICKKIHDLSMVVVKILSELLASFSVEFIVNYTHELKVTLPLTLTLSIQTLN